MNIISGVGHSRSDSVVLLVFCIIAYNGWGTKIVLQSLGTVPTLLKMGNILGRPYMRVMTYKALGFPTLKYFGLFY
jgi:hypothetical protein